MGLIQVASGIGTATFAAPVTTGSAIIVAIYSSLAETVNSVGDDHSQTYTLSGFTDIGTAPFGNRVALYYRLSSVAGVSQCVVNTSPDFEAAVLLCYEVSQVTGLADSSSATGTSNQPTGGVITDSGTGFYVAQAASDAIESSITSVDAPWTASPGAFNGAGAYLDGATGSQHPVFHSTNSGNWAVECAVFTTVLPDPPTIFAQVVPASVESGGSATLSWVASNATSLTITELGSEPLSGSLLIDPATASQYWHFTAVGAGGTVDAVVYLEVLGNEAFFSLQKVILTLKQDRTPVRGKH